jgi:hypothetical protein
MAVKTYRIKIVKGDQIFEVEGDKQFVLDMLHRFETTDAILLDSPNASKPAKTSAKTLALATISGKKMSVGEFIRQLGFKKHTDLVLAFGYYLEKFGGLNAFTPADINTCYYDSKLESSNTSQMIILNIRRGFLMQAKKGEGKKEYTLTHSGVEHVEHSGKKSAKE